MRLVRLADRALKAKETVTESAFSSAQIAVAQHILIPVLPMDQLLEFYVQSSPPISAIPEADEFEPPLPPLGQFESHLLTRLLNPSRIPLIIIGPPGSGKSTIISYIALDLIRKRYRPKINSSPTEPMVAKVDFSKYWRGDGRDTAQAERLLVSVCDELRARIDLHTNLTRKEEFTEFWEHEISLYRDSNRPSISFRKLIGGFRALGEEEATAHPPDLTSKRAQLLAKIEKDPDLHFDYLMRLWAYVIRTKYDGRRQCALVVLDNLDPVPIAIQNALVDTVLKHTYSDGPQILIALRPETLAHTSVAARLIDVIPHEGPIPAEIVYDRLGRVSKDKTFATAAHRVTADRLQPPAFFLHYLIDLYQRRGADPFGDFINHACGHNVRMALEMSHNILRLAPETIRHPFKAFYQIIRLCLRSGRPVLRWNRDSNVEHLFRVSRARSGSLLVKPRILSLLSHKEGRATLGTIREVLEGFEYDKSMILEAINDLLSSSCQLISSGGSDFYNTELDLWEYAEDVITLTDIGVGYFEYLMRRTEYVEEIMLDTYVDADRFSQELPYHTVVDRLNVLVLFLREIRRADTLEVRKFIGKRTIKEYFEGFGTHLLSAMMIQCLYPQVMRVVRGTEMYSPKDLSKREPMVEALESLTLLVEHDNGELLGIWIPPVVGHNL